MIKSNSRRWRRRRNGEQYPRTFDSLSQTLTWFRSSSWGSISPNIVSSGYVKHLFLSQALPPNRFPMQRSLETFFGIGPNTRSRIMSRFHLHDTIRVGELTQNQVLDLTAHLDSLKLENHLRRQIQQDIQRLRETGTYRGRRHAMNLPVRGQNTRSQIKTASKLNKAERY